MILNTLFSKPIEVKVSEVWGSSGNEGEQDVIVRPEFTGKLVGVVNQHAAMIPHYIVVDKNGAFHILEVYEVQAVNYDSIN